MRIATSTTYLQQATAIDNLEAQYQTEGEQLSTGKSLNAPSDNPTQIGTDLAVRTTISVQNQQAVNIQAATGQLTTTDSALADLTSLLQNARVQAERGASSFQTEGQDVANEIDSDLQQAVSIANTTYNSTYIFAGTVQSSTAPVTTTGSPVSAVNFSGNEQTQAPMLFNGQSFALSPTLQQAFNYSATNGSPSVFQTLITLRNTLSQGLVSDQSAQSINHAGQVIYGNGSPTPTTLGSTTAFSVLPKADSAGNFSIQIGNADSNNIQHLQTYTFTAATAVDDGTATSVVGAINANTATTGVTATFNAQTQRLNLTNVGGGAISFTDVPSAGATTAGNLTSVFALTATATLPQTVSTQLGDIDNALTVVLNARSLVGSRINALASFNTTITTGVVNNTALQSGIEDTNVPQATTQFSQTQAALTASYSTTERLEQKDLFDYL